MADDQAKRLVARLRNEGAVYIDFDTKAFAIVEEEMVASRREENEACAVLADELRCDEPYDLQNAIADAIRARVSNG